MKCPLYHQMIERDVIYETKDELQMVCSGYFLHMIKDVEEPKWLEFTFWRDGTIRFDMIYPNCCRKSLDIKIKKKRKK